MKAIDETYQSKPLSPSQKLKGVSDRALAIHHDDLYKGYVKKANEIQTRLETLRKEATDRKVSGNSTYSELRALKQDETYAVNGIYLHEWYFEGLNGAKDESIVPRNAAPALIPAIEEQFDSSDAFVKFFTECAMSARGWTVLAWDTKANRLAIFNGDAHNQGGVWGAIPIIVLDVYEHAYFMDFGADRKKYIDSFWKSLDWKTANRIYEKASTVVL